MDVFRNQQRSGYDEIVSYGPRWWTEFKEMDAVYMFEGWLLDLMAHHLKMLVNNQFPTQADEQALEIFEKVLGLKVSPDATLDERRADVVLFYGPTGKMSAEEIAVMIRKATGCECEIYMEDDYLNIRIILENERNFSNINLTRAIKNRLPVYMMFHIREVLAVFRHTEVVETRYKARFPFSWWPDRLDGSLDLNGSTLLDKVLPNIFRAVTRIGVKSEESYSVRDTHRFEHTVQDEFSVAPSYRVLMPWWSGNMLDGSDTMSGDYTMSQDRGTIWDRARNRLCVETGEELGFNMYIPSKAARFNGSARLDGKLSLNSGREVL